MCLFLNLMKTIHARRHLNHLMVGFIQLRNVESDGASEGIWPNILVVKKENYSFSHSFIELLLDTCYVTGLSRCLSGRVHLQCRSHRRRGFDPRVRKIPWRRVWQPIPVFLHGESHRQRNLTGYSSWGGSQRVRYSWSDLAHTHTI